MSTFNTATEPLTKDLRRHVLMRELSKYGLHLRSDSQLCNEYIEYGEDAQYNDVNTIVSKMCEAHFFHFYCNHEVGHLIAVNTKRHRKSRHRRRYSGQQFLRLLRRCILLTTRYNRLPDIWPWTVDISPQEWRHHHDISHLLLANPNTPRDEYPGGIIYM
jgi:hypothetical protein